MEILASLGVNETVFIQMGIFLVVFIALKMILFNSYFAAYKQRKENTVGQTEAAARYLNETRELEGQYSNQVRQINDQYKAIFDKNRSEATRQADQVIQAARAKSRQWIEETREKIDKEIRDARQKMQPEVPTLGQMITAKLFGKGSCAMIEIPWTTIGIEAFNFFLLIGGLVYLLRHTVTAHFRDKYKTYTELVDRAETAKAAARKGHDEISQRLKSVQSTAEETIRRAKAEAEEFKQKSMLEAQAQAKKMEEDAKRTAVLEVERAKDELRAELLHASIENSRESLRKSLGSSDQKRLQTEFMDKIQVVGR